MYEYKAVAESNSFIVLDKYVREWQLNESYQSEGDLEREFIQDLHNQGYEYEPGLNTPEKLLANVREQLQTLNNMQFTDGEWMRFVETWLDKPSDSIVDKTRKIHNDYIHDFVFDDGHIQNIYLVDKKTLPAIRFRSSSSLSNRVVMPIVMMSLFW
ncbi:HsdR protein [Klebsiella grimontii]|uniref:HsdR protein n=1 Tax=Klebsiella grimontii TaxID=2058152 RepID=A0A7H4PB64_9ENTR|nr:HsdR protein [Klebsiella grimontii]